MESRQPDRGECSLCNFEVLVATSNQKPGVCAPPYTTLKLIEKGIDLK
jgi:hypothetical protein